jgi:hypothetical protein
MKIECWADLPRDYREVAMLLAIQPSAGKRGLASYISNINSIREILGRLNRQMNFTCTSQSAL